MDNDLPGPLPDNQQFQPPPVPVTVENLPPPEPVVAQPVPPDQPLPPLFSPSSPAETPEFSQDDQPTAVVKALSVRGLEYAMMSITLWLASAALVVIVLLLVNGTTSFSVLAFPISLLVVALPIFSYFFLRLKRAEVARPALRFDPSKRRLSQITQLFTFVTCLITLIGIAYTIIAKLGGTLATPLSKTLLDLIIILIVAGGLFTYYWHDEHRPRG